MGAWFEDLPLDFTRAETRTAARLIETAYPTNDEVVALAEDIGLDLGRINQTRPVWLLARDVLGDARRADRLLALVAQVLGDPRQAGFHGELRRLIAGYETAVRDAGMCRSPSLATLMRLPLAIDAWGPADAEPLSVATARLEKTINVMAGFVDPAEFRRGVAEAEVRTARVEIGGHAKGTGFLVGPDLMMTNWHVVERGVDGAVARFDCSAASPGRPVAFAENWLVAHSTHDSEVNELSPGGPQHGTWDFAVVLLAEPVGEQAIGPDPTAQAADPRGHYRLEWGPYDFESAEPLLILGYPDGGDRGAIQLSYASPAGARLTSGRNRVRYDTNTSGGSSGSPVFNRDFRIVALHNAAGKGAGPGTFNQGVPIAGIESALRTQLDGRPELAILGLS